MKQLLQYLRSGETIVADVPVPSPRYGTALVQTACSLVSPGTERMIAEFAEKSLLGKARSRPDLVRQVLDKVRKEGLLSTYQATTNRLDQPLALGYSSSGTITALGDGLPGFKVGQRVACAGGGHAVHAEYAIIPKNLLVPLPDNVDFESAAFATLGAIALHGFHLSEARLGERVAVIGLGLLGLLCVQLAAAGGCQVLGIDINPARVDLANKLSVQAVLRSQAEAAASSFTHGEGCDSVIICADTTTSDPVALAAEIARDRARVIPVGAVGLQLPRKPYYEKELTLINSRSYGPGRYDPSYEENGQDYPIGFVRWSEGRNLHAVIDLISTDQLKVQPLITHRFPIDRATEAYQLIREEAQEHSLGILLTYEQKPLVMEISEDLSVEIKKPVADQFTSGVSKPDRVRLGILGAGNFALSTLLPVIKDLPNLDLVGISSSTGLKARHAADKYGFHYAASDEKKILHDPQVNTVAILTRHHLHARQVISAIHAGKHVFCEKPLALNQRELDEINDLLVNHPGLILSVGFNRRFAPLVVRMRDFLHTPQEPLVATYRINAGFLSPDHWLHDPQQGGGRIIGEACHFIDSLCYLVGENPRTVSVKALPDDGRYHEDNVVITLSFPNGSLGTIAYLANGDKAYTKERLEVFCAGKVAVLDDFRLLETVTDGKRSVTKAKLRQDKGHRQEWQAFISAILQGGEPPIPYSQLIAVSQASFVALEALRTGGEITLQ